MHIIGVIIALATAVFWVGRAARGAKDIVDIASSLKNMQRPSRFKSRNPQRDISIIDEPMDAAVILMICVGKLSSFGQMGKDQISTSVHSKSYNFSINICKYLRPKPLNCSRKCCGAHKVYLNLKSLSVI